MRWDSTGGRGCLFPSTKLVIKDLYATKIFLYEARESLVRELLISQSAVVIKDVVKLEGLDNCCCPQLDTESGSGNSVNEREGQLQC